MTGFPLASCLVGLVAGFLVGLFHFASLWWNARMLAGGLTGKSVIAQVGRFAVVAAVFILLAKLLGAGALLGGLLGFLAARHPLLRRFGEIA
jgi:F1F0 ATPase subunit 2